MGLTEATKKQEALTEYWLSDDEFDPLFNDPLLEQED